MHNNLFSFNCFKLLSCKFCKNCTMISIFNKTEKSGIQTRNLANKIQKHSRYSKFHIRYIPDWNFFKPTLSDCFADRSNMTLVLVELSLSWLTFNQALTETRHA